jgi:trimethylamine---corrinoid protein Co-methyltransferase
MTTDQPRSRRRGAARGPVRAPDYIHLTHPFTPQAVFAPEAVAELHATALRVLDTLGLRILLPEARRLFRTAGALVDEPEQMVRIGPEIVAAALASAPRSWRMRAAHPGRERIYAEGQMLFSPGSGCPNATDLVRGRRSGSLRDFTETLRLQQSFDVIHMFGPSAEPQDVAPALRHYAMMRAQMVDGDKPMFVYARGRAQVAESFEMIRLGLGLSEADWAGGVWANTVINTNSPRQIDVPMAEGIIDFARAGQMSIITPFCLAGAMAPVTVAGALVLQHAEALAGITLAQLARPGAPVSYGGFSSNVDMRSGAPAFGTPEHLKLQIGTGQLARHIGLPWRSATGSASNAPDMQAAQETTMALWGALMANATLTIHAAGWLEGGLTFGYEKFINDIEALQTVAELCIRPEADTAALAYDALTEVEPGGHFFAAAHTMTRYDHAFYSPLLADLSNFGTWTEAGAQDSATRATRIWQDVLAHFVPPPGGAEAADRLAPYIAARTRAGGAAPGD